jgi:outer membrane lipoprotein carrier protein
MLATGAQAGIAAVGVANISESTPAGQPATGAVSAADATRLLNQALAGLTSLRAQFTQTITNTKGVAQSASGTLLILKPGLFRWDYTKPRQSLVCDGKRLWFYDEDLAQVTVKKAASVLANSPAQLLAGQYRWQEHFSASLQTSGSTVVIQLTPLSNQPSDFTGVQLRFRQDQLVGLAFSDKLNQHTEIVLSAPERNVKLTAADFVFKPPAGVDVVGEP